MQRMLQSYKCMKDQRKLSGCASNLLAHEDLGHLRKPCHRNIQAKFYNKKFLLEYESDKTRDSLYEEHGATMRQKCGKRIVTLPLLSFSLIIFFVGSFWPLYLFIQNGLMDLIPTFLRTHQSPPFFPHWDNALIMMIIIVLFTYNSILKQKYDSI